MVAKALPVAVTVAATERASARRRDDLIFLKACSIGLHSGEYLGVAQIWQPAAAMACRARGLFGTLRWSQLTICPGRHFGTSHAVTKVSNTSRSSAPGNDTASPIPASVIVARSVLVVQRRLGTAPMARSPRGARARSGVSPVGVLVSSTTTTGAGSSPAIFAWNAARSAGSCSRAINDFL